MPRRPRRGLPNNPTTVDALPSLTTGKAKELSRRFGVLSERELASRVEINWERYVKVSNIEASCALDMARTLVLAMLRASIADYSPPPPPPPPPGHNHRLAARGTAGDDLELPRLRFEDVVEQLAQAAPPPRRRPPLRVGATSLPELAEGRHRPEPDLAVRLHRQQVRVPRRGLVRPNLLAADRAQHGRRGLAVGHR